MGGRRSTGTAAILTAAISLCFSMVLIVPAGAQVVVSEERESRRDIRINSDAGFTPENGIRTGSGTARDPYVISGWQINNITIADTGKHLVVRDNTINGTLRLNWNGDRLTVVNNEIGDLRVNENVKRTGGPTSGRIANNKIGVVGQLRHWDGVFEKNVVGSAGSMNAPFFSNRAVNFDGFNGARFRNNKIFGYVDVRLHGHHHGSGFGEGNSHDHSLMGAEYGENMMDHSKRYHQVWVTNNTIHAADERYALRYYDQAHAANDRTANSEPNPELNKPHTHFTRVHLNNNVLEGGIAVDIFNAKDELHKEYAYGTVEVKNNEISLKREALDTFETRTGIDVYNVRFLTLKVIGNEIRADFSGDPTEAVFSSGEAGIRLRNVERGDLLLESNSVYDMHYGIYASQMTENVRWWVMGLQTGNVEKDVHWDSSVKNEPERRS